MAFVGLIIEIRAREKRESSFSQNLGDSSSSFRRIQRGLDQPLLESLFGNLKPIRIQTRDPDFRFAFDGIGRGSKRNDRQITR